MTKTITARIDSATALQAPPVHNNFRSRQARYGQISPSHPTADVLTSKLAWCRPYEMARRRAQFANGVTCVAPSRGRLTESGSVQATHVKSARFELSRAIPSGGEPSTLVDVLRCRAGEDPERVVFSMLKNDGEETAQLDYQTLDRRACALAALLTEFGSEGERALLLLPHHVPFAVGLYGTLYAGAIAVPVQPPAPWAPQSATRLQSIAEDCQPRFVLTTSEVSQSLDGEIAASPALRCAIWVNLDTLDEALASEWRERRRNPTAPAVLQYTSGSTSTPRGVVVSHANLLHNSALIKRRMGHSRDTRGALWLPPYHDMGLVGGYVQAVFADFHGTWIPTMTFLARPMRWLEAIDRLHVTTSGGPNFAYDLCVERSTPEQRACVDLSSWEIAFSGADHVRAETLDRFAAAFRVSGFRPKAFYPCYGLAEATLLVTGGDKGASVTRGHFDADALRRGSAVPVEPGSSATRVLVGCGRGSDDQQVKIVDPETKVARLPGVVGEIWAAGPSVAARYWNQPDATTSVFGTAIAGSTDAIFMRTGDLGFIHEEELYVTGRIKDVLIVDGRNYYAEDIEQAAERSHPALSEARFAAFSLERFGAEEIVVWCERRRSIRRGNSDVDDEQLGAAIQRGVAEECGLRLDIVKFVKQGAMPLTPSGKVRRHACRAIMESETAPSVASTQ